MEVMNMNLEESFVKSGLSFTDLRAKLFPEKLKVDRSIKSSEQKYTAKTLVGNWFERRAVVTPPLDDWKTLYNTDYKPQINKYIKENEIALWDNKFDVEGLPWKILGYYGEEYDNNMTTTYDLSYKILPKSTDPKIRSYIARKRKWIPEQDLTQSYGNLTQFGLREAINHQQFMISKEGITSCDWRTTYGEEIGRLDPSKIERITKFNKRTVDFNVPDLRHFERKSSGIQPCLFPLKTPNHQA